jgi:hypothetical protein
MSSQHNFVASLVSLNDSYNPFSQPAPSPYGELMNSYSTQTPALPTTNPFLSQIPTQNLPAQSTGQTMGLPYAPADANRPQLQHHNTVPSFPQSSPFTQSQHQHQQPLLQPQQQQQSSFNPFSSLPTRNPPVTSYQSQINALLPRQMGRIDKSSILALYNFSPPAPTIPEQPGQLAQQPATDILTSQPQSQSQPAHSTQPQSIFNASLSPDPLSAGSRNPFLSSVPLAGGTVSNPSAPVPLGAPVIGTKSQMAGRSPFARTHTSQESVDIGSMQNGRHSPDVFASLSARYVQ